MGAALRASDKLDKNIHYDHYTNGLVRKFLPLARELGPIIPANLLPEKKPHHVWSKTMDVVKKNGFVHHHLDQARSAITQPQLKDMHNCWQKYYGKVLHKYGISGSARDLFSTGLAFAVCSPVLTPLLKLKTASVTSQPLVWNADLFTKGGAAGTLRRTAMFGGNLFAGNISDRHGLDHNIVSAVHAAGIALLYADREALERAKGGGIYITKIMQLSPQQRLIYQSFYMARVLALLMMQNAINQKNPARNKEDIAMQQGVAGAALQIDLCKRVAQATVTGAVSQLFDNAYVNAIQSPHTIGYRRMLASTAERTLASMGMSAALVLGMAGAIRLANVISEQISPGK